VTDLHLAMWAECSIAGAMAVAGAGPFCLAWIFSPTQGLRRVLAESRHKLELPET